MSISRFAASNFLATLIPQILTLVTIPIYLQLIGPERFGVLSISWLLLGYFGLFDLGMGPATAYKISAQKEAEPTARSLTFWNALFVNIVMGLLGGAVLWGASFWYFNTYFKVDELLKHEMLASIPILAISLPISTLTSVLTGALQGRELFKDINRISVISTIFFQIVPIIFALCWGPELTLLLLSALAVRMVAVVFLWHICYAEFIKDHPFQMNLKELKALTGYGGWVSANAFIGPLLMIVDRFAIGNVLGAAALAYYTVPFQIAKRLTILPAALGTAIFPRMTILDEYEARRLSERSLKTLNCILLPIAVLAIFLMEPFLTIWVGSYISDNASETGRVLLVAFWISSLSVIPFTRLQAKGKPKLITYIYILELPIYFFLLYFGMIYFGLLGCAVALLARLTLDFCLLSWFAERRIIGLQRIVESTALVATAVVTAQLFRYGTIWWLLSIAAIATMAALHALYYCPKDLRDRGVSVVRSLYWRVR